MSNKSYKAIISDTYLILDLLGSGAFGEVYMAKRKTNNQMVAVKVEERGKISRMENEYKIYKKLNKIENILGIPKIYDFIQTPKYNIMCMQLLDKNLDDLFTINKSLKLPTVFKLAYEIMCIMEKFHGAGFIHRDIKPNNFMTSKDDDKVYIMDFGLSKKYIDNDGKHIKFRSDRTLIGTARYASINMHMGMEPSRRDDLESIGYMFVYFLKGSLPWQGLKKTGMNQIEAIGEVKMVTDLASLCDCIPKCFMEYISYCRNLNFDETPNYDYLKNLFITYANNNKIKIEYEWLKP